MVKQLPPALQALLPAGRWLTAPGDCLPYGFDNSKRHGPVLAVGLPENTAEVQRIVEACAQARLPLLVRGRGTATTGATVPLEPSVVLCTERMRAIRRFSPENRYVEVEPGLLNGELQAFLRPYGFFWPPDPTSAPYASIGGNLACNAGGPRTVKYGASRDNVLGLSFVDGRGQLHRCGSHTSKGAVGYDLSRLLIGSEGTLGVICSATLKLVPSPAASASLRLAYASVEAAAEAVARLMAQPATPSALEFMDQRAIELVRERGGVALPAAAALLLLEVDGARDALPGQIEAVTQAAAGPGLLECRRADSAEEVAELWAARKALSPVLRSLKPRKINEDVVVPVAALPALVRGLEALAARERILIVNFGHAGNGNLHVNLLYDPADADEAARCQRALPAVFELVLALEGTLSGEHGIGIDKRDFVPGALGAGPLALMRGIKAVFDPEGILNPGKLWPP